MISAESAVQCAARPAPPASASGGDLESRLATMQAQLDMTLKLEARLAQLEAEAKGWSSWTTRRTSSGRRATGHAQAPGATAPDDACSDSEPLSDATSSLAIEELEELEEGDGVPPDSLFACTVVRLAFGHGRGTWWAVAQLLTLVFVELILAAGLLDATRCRLIVRQWKPPEAEVNNRCFYQGNYFTSGHSIDFQLYIRSMFSYRKIWSGQPLDLAVGIICLTILALYVRDGNIRLLSLATFVRAVQHRLEPRLRLLLLVVDRVRTLATPTVVLVAAALQLAHVPDVIDIILNAFAVTFMLDMDRLLFAVALGPGEKHVYNKLWEAKGMQAFLHCDPKTSNGILLLDMVALGSAFFLPRILDWSAGDDYQYELLKFVGNTCKLIGLARAVMFEVSIAGTRAKDDQDADFWRQLRTGAWLLMWAVFDLVFVVVIYGLVNFPLFQTDTQLDYDSFRGCLNGTQLSACQC